MIYDKPTRILMKDFVAEKIVPGQVFRKEDAIEWFRQKYPDIKPVTVGMHVEAMAVNSNTRKHHQNVYPGSGHDLFFKLGRNQYRLWDQGSDTSPVYRDDSRVGALEAQEAKEAEQISVEGDEEDLRAEGTKEFALERHLRDYLARNLGLIERGMRLYEDEEISGVEFPVGGRFIDILAVDTSGNFAVIELKVSRGYERTIGQLLRYMGWVKKHLAGEKRVRGLIVAAEITEDLKLAASQIPDVQLREYELSFSLKAI